MLKNKTVFLELAEAVSSHPDQIFLIEGGKEITFQQFKETSDRLAGSLLKLGLKHGDNIAIIALNQTEWLYTFFAAAKIGVGLVTLNVRYRDTELEYMINNADVKAIVSLASFQDFNYVEFFQGFKNRIPGVKTFIYIGGEKETSFDFLLDTIPNEDALQNAASKVQEEDTALIIYTSGTTGKPKGAMITHKSLLASARAQASHFNITEKDKAIGSLPFNHVGGITCTIMVALTTRGSVVLIPGFRPDLVLEAIQVHKATIFGGVPTMYVMLLSAKGQEKYNLDSINLCIIGGSNVEPQLCNLIDGRFPKAHLVNLYGLSETSGACVLSRLTDDISKVQQTIGVVIGDFQAKAVNENGEEVVNEVGELLIKGACVGKGYYGMPDTTRDSFIDGWLHTGDMVIKDEEGYLHYMGRKKEMYISGGFNIFPVEIENVLTLNEKVQIAAGFGIPDPVLGEVGVFYIVPKTEAEITENELHEYCKSRLADYKIPKKFIFVKEVPLTPAGKVQKAALIEQYKSQKV
ncbi:long-chain fatty acid--CoA ligase [Bacillus sp. M6-12]|uniref:class I adenylate-forming enzyme family protein n=1 Tax=Bacillus sp. M6-12 TaxID=2054166 RepID=UPI000C7570E2|nr:AMP-binding protein [Bacillus sp. M6-12]PLS18663.1 long-chain fatty acid--CoA ligase [Bacillus sp. M6-12]